MDGGVLGWAVPAVGHTKEDVYRFSPPDRWTNGTGKPNAGNLPTYFRQLRTKRLVPPATIGRIRIQQFGHHGHQVNPLLRQLWISFTYDMALGARNPKSSVKAIWPLDEGGTCPSHQSLGRYTSRHEPLLRPTSSTPSGIQS